MVKQQKIAQLKQSQTQMNIVYILPNACINKYSSNRGICVIVIPTNNIYLILKLLYSVKK